MGGQTRPFAVWIDGLFEVAVDIAHVNPSTKYSLPLGQESRLRGIVIGIGSFAVWNNSVLLVMMATCTIL